MENIKKVAITGGVGSGKSTVINLIKEMGYKTCSCDDICHNLYKSRKFLLKLKKYFPNAIKGKIILSADRKLIADEVFIDTQKLQLLNSLTHSEILKKVDNFANKYRKKYGIIFVEVPLLFESNLQNNFDNVIIVTRQKEKRIDACINRSNWSKTEVENRINNQFDYDNADLSNYILLENNGDKEELHKKVNEVIEKIY